MTALPQLLRPENPVVRSNPAIDSAPCAALAAAIPVARAENEAEARWFRDEIQAHEPELRAYLRGRFPSLRDIDDLVQETYARILRAREAGRATLTRAYLFVTARNAALDQLRRRKIISVEAVAEFDRLPVVAEAPDAAETASHAQELQLLADAIATLPERCRRVFVLRRYYDLSHKEIAQQLGIAENTVNAQLVTAMLRCREYLRAHGVTGAERSHGVERS